MYDKNNNKKSNDLSTIILNILVLNKCVYKYLLNKGY